MGPVKRGHWNSRIIGKLPEPLSFLLEVQASIRGGYVPTAHERERPSEHRFWTADFKARSRSHYPALTATVTGSSSAIIHYAVTAMIEPYGHIAAHGVDVVAISRPEPMTRLKWPPFSGIRVSICSSSSARRTIGAIGVFICLRNGMQI